jgi:hypothetical protein
MERPLVKAAGITAGALFIAIGLSAQFGGGHLLRLSPPGGLLSRPAASSPVPSPSPTSSPSPTPNVEEDSMSVAGTIYAGWQAGPKKKHGK